MSSRRLRGRQRDDGPTSYEDLDEEELQAELRRRAHGWFTRQRLSPEATAATPSPAPPLALAGDGAPTTLPEARAANDAKPKRRPRRDPDGLRALRRRAWAWLRPKAQDEATKGDPPKRQRKREPAVATGARELRRRAWAWFAPRTVDLSAKREPPPTAGPIVRGHLRGVLEALIFASEDPMSARDLARIAGADAKLVRELLSELIAEYQPRGVRLEEIAGGFVFRTSPAFAPFVREQVAKKPVKMTRAQVETLAIVAYRQPITRPEVDEVRGVDSGAVMKSLLERDLVRILGKKDEPGRPMLYGTTASFLEFFGLKALADLPTLREFTELNDESKRTFDREMEEHEAGGLMGGEGAMKPPSPPADQLEDREDPSPVAGSS